MDQVMSTLEELGSQSFLGNSLRTWLVAGLIIAVGVLLSRLARSLLTRYGPRLASFTKTDLDDHIVQGATGPVAAMVLLPPFHVCIYMISMPGELRRVLVDALAVAMTLLVTVIGVRVVDAFFRYGVEPAARRQGRRVDPQVLAFGRKLAKALVVMAAALVIMRRVGLDVMSLITGLGIGGLAVALAAQETLGNMLGSLQIMTDQPYTVGDFIRFEGTFGEVKDIGLRSTKILTGSGVKVVIPNKRLAEGNIENCSAHQGITVQFNIGLIYGTTADQVARAVQLLREIVQSQQATHAEVKVHFISFGASSLDLQVVYFVIDFAHFLDVQHAINLEIKRRFDEAGLSFAFPTRTLHVIQEPTER